MGAVSKIQFLINNHLFAKLKMSVDDFSQNIGRNTYLKGTDIHKFSIGKCIEKDV